MNITCPHCKTEFDVLTSPNVESSPKTKPFLEWKEEYDIGIPEIDEQHHQIVRLVNEIHHVVKTGQRPENFIPKIFKELSDYIKYHFSFEEQLFINSKYPDIKAHLALHHEFARQIESLHKAYESSFFDTNILLGFIAAWFLEHIQGTDRTMTAYLVEYIEDPSKNN